jgi:hypothetical protein
MTQSVLVAIAVVLQIVKLKCRAAGDREDAACVRHHQAHRQAAGSRLVFKARGGARPVRPAAVQLRAATSRRARAQRGRDGEQPCAYVLEYASPMPASCYSWITRRPSSSPALGPGRHQLAMQCPTRDTISSSPHPCASISIRSIRRYAGYHTTHPVRAAACLTQRPSWHVIIAGPVRLWPGPTSPWHLVYSYGTKRYHCVPP